MIFFRYILSLLFIVSSFQAGAQDTLNVMHYNLLNYGVITDYCDNSNNNIDDKESYLRTIVNYNLPDILTVNEISKSEIIHQRLLDNVLNSNGRFYFRKSSFLSGIDSRIVNMLYYNSKKLTFYSHSIAQSYIRDIDVYTLYYNANDLVNGDTVFIHCVVAHLKAGDGVSNANKRNSMAANTMNYLDTNREPGNYLLMGDFNIYSDEEPAYVQFLYYSNSSWRFNDPIDRSGPWSNNKNYSDVHTQSTHASSNGCAAPGGMDDRFDFVLISDDIEEGNRRVKYLPGSYDAIGQDGEHFNSSIISSPINTSVPNDVLYALYFNSDHLPVTMKIVVDKILDISELRNTEFQDIVIHNPSGNLLRMTVTARENTRLALDIINLSGQVVFANLMELSTGSNSINFDVGSLKKGFYLVRFTDSNGNTVIKKLVKN